LWTSDSETMASQVQVRKQAPDFTATAFVDNQFKKVTNKDYHGKYLILFFYPSDFTFVCPTEIIAFSDRVKEFKENNCELLACSTDSEFCHRAWIMTDRKKGGLEKINFPILADTTLEISTRYGVLIKEEGVAFRGLFIINEKGIVRHISINDTPVGRSVDEALRLVQGFQYTDKHGEVCPVNWKPGKKAIVIDANKTEKK